MRSWEKDRHVSQVTASHIIPLWSIFKLNLGQLYANCPSFCHVSRCTRAHQYPFSICQWPSFIPSVDAHTVTLDLPTTAWTDWPWGCCCCCCTPALRKNPSWKYTETETSRGTTGGPSQRFCVGVELQSSSSRLKLCYCPVVTIDPFTLRLIHSTDACWKNLSPSSPLSLIHTYKEVFPWKPRVVAATHSCGNDFYRLVGQKIEKSALWWRPLKQKSRGILENNMW